MIEDEANLTSDEAELINIVPYMLLIAPGIILVSWLLSLFGRSKRAEGSPSIRQLNKMARQMSKENMRQR